MGANSKIDWTDHTWNPWYGCPEDGRRSPACDNCYARSWAKRSGIVDFDREIKRAADSTFNAPLNRNKYKPGDRVFVCSLSDFFHEDVPEKFIADAYEVMMQRTDMTWIFLTKRPENVREADNWIWDDTPKNFWLGVTVENQEEADRRVPALLQIPAAVRFLSCEPLLGAIDLVGEELCQSCDQPFGESGEDENGFNATCVNCGNNTYYRSRGYLDEGDGLDWVICGGESGSSARAMHPDWARSLRDQCQHAWPRVPFFFKQWGEWMPEDPGTCSVPVSGWTSPDGVGSYSSYTYRDSKGVRWAKSPQRLKDDGFAFVAKVGKKIAGNELDGRVHQEWPKCK